MEGNLAKVKKFSDNLDIYNDCPTWRLGLFALNNIATNLYMFAMGYISMYASGIAGLLVTVVGFILTAMRIFDGITDPIVGFLIDKTDGKFGKFRPFIVVGNIILGIMTFIIYTTVHKVPENIRLIYFIGCYAVYIIGYTCQTACTKAGQACMTNNPSKRPKFGLFDAIYNAILFNGMQIYMSSYLVPKYGGFGEIGLYHELITFTIIVSAILTSLAIVGIWTKDRSEFFGLGSKTKKVGFKDYWPVLKGNRALQMLVVAASTDKIASNVASNAAVTVMLFGILMGDYSLAGTIGTIVLIPNILITMFGTKYAQKLGQKKALVLGTWASIISFTALFALLVFGDPTQISLKNVGFMTIAFIGVYILARGSVSVSGAFVIPMISDCADYETYLSGRFVPGMMGTLFSFIDKLISSFATTIVAFGVASIGFADRMPDVTDTANPQIFWMTMFLFIGMPMLGWIASLIAMKFYPLDKVKMEEVQAHIQELKNA
ncbi:Sugar transporter protein [Romboutsia ilealis]|uniref:Sugar transporter protein n=1 Tax=Romboutsia ilealis TaxID=1115758 RepID=A0A1V1I448_9FIRM|nr:MFS transporter [Romboutsia ilealis]CED94897.1 Sugar transporter protein [Romboutsia ilealis]